MSSDPKDLLVLISVPHEVEAAAIVAALDRQGIRAVATGGSLSGFKAHVPGEVQVLVQRSDSDRAQQALQKIRSQESPINWTEVDVGDPQE